MRGTTVSRLGLCALLALSLVAVAPPVTADAGGSSWHWLNPLPRGETLSGLDMVDASIGYAVGREGCLMKTYDGGVSWISKSSGTTEDLQAVSFIDSDTGWVGGANGVILKTDGSSGATWTQQATGVTDGVITGIHFLDANTGWACDQGNRIFRTTNGGTTWFKTDVPGADFTAIHFVSSSVGYAVTGTAHKVYKSIDGGVTWPEVSAQNLGTYLTDITFKPGDPSIGWISSWSKPTSAYKTTTSGASWLPQAIGTGGELSSVSYSPASDTVWFVGYNGQTKPIVKVADGSVPSFVEYAYGPYGVSFSPSAVDSVASDKAVAVGFAGTVTRTTDGGTSWSDRGQKIPRENLRRVQFLDLRTGYIASDDGKVYKSTDAGQTWSATGISNTSALYGLYFLDVNTGWAVGSSGRIFKTVNGGASWTQQTSAATNSLNAVRFVDANHGWIAGSSGWVLYTDNGGTTWTRQGAAVLGANSYTDIDFVSATEGAVVGSNGAVFRTSDGGVAWEACPGMPAGATGEWTSIDYVAANTFYVAGPVMTTTTIEFSMLKTSNRGSGFMRVPADNTVYTTFKSHGRVWDIDFADASKGWAVFSDGTVAKTVDGGNTWYYEDIADEYDTLRSLSVVGGTAVWTAGINARVLSNYWYTPTVVYRFYNKVNGTHFYTSDVNEKHHIIDTWPDIYQFEGTGYEYDAMKANQPLYRFYNKVSGSHFYTCSEAEKATVIAKWPNVYTYEGPAYNVTTTPVGPSSTVYRFYNLKNGSHFYTASPEERDTVMQKWPTVYKYEGPAFYLPL